MLDAIRRPGADPQLAAEVVRQAREQLTQRREEHGKDVAVAENALRGLNAGVTALAGDVTTTSTARVDKWRFRYLVVAGARSSPPQWK